MAKDYRELPKIRDSLSYLYLEHSRIEQDGKAIASYDLSGKISIPCASLTLLMLGPGTSITHEAIKTIALNGCSIIWVGEEGVRFYAQGLGETRKSKRLLAQVKLYSDPGKRIEVIRRMFSLRFPDDLDADHMTIEELKGQEGIRVRAAYARMSREHGIRWEGREYHREKWHQTNMINKALSAANACLYGICHAAIVSIGCSPGIGFLHTGKQLSFVYDIADLYKTELTLPTAFSVVSEGETSVEKRVRMRLRDHFREKRLLERIVKDIDYVLAISETTEEDVYDSDAAIPGPLWDGEE